MRREPISLEHKDIVTESLKDLDVDLSEYCFANLYLFRKVHEYELIFADALYIEGKTYDGARFVMPLSMKAWHDETTLKALSQNLDCIYPIPEAWLSTHTFHTKTFLDQDSDYLYTVTKLAHYSGRDLSKKRNLEKQFMELCDAKTQILTKESINQALDVIHSWQKNSVDTEPSIEAITRFEELNLDGMLVWCDNKPVGVILGEPLNAKTFVIHFATANTDYKGVYQFMYQKFIEKLEGKYLLVNMEQDLGDPNLQKAKHSYHPCQIAPKWRVKLIV